MQTPLKSIICLSLDFNGFWMRAFVTVAHTAFPGAMQFSANGYHRGPQLMHVPKHAVRPVGGKCCHGTREACLQNPASRRDERTKWEGKTELLDNLRATACENENTALAGMCPNTVTHASVREILCLVKQLWMLITAPITGFTSYRDRWSDGKVFMNNCVIR